MAAANGVFHFIYAAGRMRGMSADVSAYFDDTAGNFVRFDQSAKATAASNDSWIPPAPCILTDIVMAGATAQTTTQLMRNQVPSGDFILNALVLASVTNRTALRVPVPAGVKFQAKQLA
jgi:hypothetical protein